MPSPIRISLVLFLLVVLVGAPWAYSVHREERTRGFRVVEAGVLYRSGQLSVAGLKRVLHDHNIRTIVCLRDGHKDNDQDEEALCRQLGIKHVRIAPRSWTPVNGVAPVEIGLRDFHEVMDDPAHHPVLIHCFAGVHRTGAYCAVYRMDYHGWTNAQAIAEMRALGYETLDSDLDIRGFLESYPGRAVP